MRSHVELPSRYRWRDAFLALLVPLVVAAAVGCDRDRPVQQAENRFQRTLRSPDVSHETPDHGQPIEPPSEDSNDLGGGGDRVESNTESREARISAAIALQGNGELKEAAKLLRSLLLIDPHDAEVIFHLANTQAARGNMDQAIELLADIPTDHPQAGLPALGVSADWCSQVERYNDAEQRYRKIIEIDPAINIARRKLAYLLNRQGRRHEAVALIRELCESGDVMQDELHALVVESDAIYDPPGSKPAAGARPYWPIGESGQARYLFTEKHYLKAAELVKPIVESGEALPSVIAFFGRAAVEAQHDEMLSLWRTHVNDAVKEFPEYWAALGTYLIREAEYEQGVRALAEAVRRDPTDLRSTRRLFQGLRSLNQSERADVWIERYGKMNRIVRASNAIAEIQTKSDEPFHQLADDLESVGRRLEAVLWRSVSATRNSGGEDELSGLKRKMQQILSDETAFPNDTTKWCGMKLDDVPLPQFPAKIASSNVGVVRESRRSTSPGPPPPAAFRDISQTIGLNHRYRVARQPVEKAFAMYQTYGGGVAVVDYDLDGRADIYLAQGAADADNFVADESDRFYRTVLVAGTEQLVDVTVSSGIEEQDYTLGVTAGDWNQDGFPDLAVANVGVNRLLINQGDGTFVSRPLDDQPDFTTLSTSLAMGDVTGDQLPDLFVVNYLRDPEIARRPELNAAGEPVDAISPLSVKPSRDLIYTNSNGRSIASFVGTDDSSACTGLGIVMTDLHDDHPGNEVFVANDVRSNQFWVRSEAGGFVDLAIPYGCAYGSLGSATAAMGIAASDLDRTGTIDLHVTNFANEPVSMYVGRDGLFRDMNFKFNLTHPSTPMLGFGTQAIDYSNDGWLDLVVTNGHVEDLRSQGQLFRQPMQLFANLGARFDRIDVPDSDFWSKPHLGRAVARLDFNRDGKLDFVMTDLLDSTALVLNETPSTHHWVSLRLVGTTSERDAIGSRIELQAGNQVWTAWVTAGDGYLCKNESAVHFGIGAESSVEQVRVVWPSGQTQTYGAVPVDRSTLLVESNPDAFVMSR